MHEIDPSNSYGTPEGPETLTSGSPTEPRVVVEVDQIDGKSAHDIHAKNKKSSIR